MINAKRLLRAENADKPDLAAITQAVDEYESAREGDASSSRGRTATARSARSSSATPRSFLTTAKQLMRRMRDKAPYS